MPSINALCDDIAIRFGIEPARSRGIARYMREAGMLSQGARGVNAPRATTVDAARLLFGNMLVWRPAINVVADASYVGLWVTRDQGQFRTTFPFDTFEQAVAGALLWLGETESDDPVNDEVAHVAGLSVNAVVGKFSIVKWDNEKHDYHEEEYRFFDKKYIDLTPKDGVNFELSPMAFSNPFDLEPHINNRDFFALAKVVAGKKPIGWKFP